MADGYGVQQLVGETSGLPQVGWSVKTVPDGYTGSIQGSVLVVGGEVADGVAVTLTSPAGVDLAVTVDVVEDGLFTEAEVRAIAAAQASEDVAPVEARVTTVEEGLAAESLARAAADATKQGLVFGVGVDGVPYYDPAGALADEAQVVQFVDGAPVLYDGTDSPVTLATGAALAAQSATFSSALTTEQTDRAEAVAAAQAAATGSAVAFALVFGG